MHHQIISNLLILRCECSKNRDIHAQKYIFPHKLLRSIFIRKKTTEKQWGYV